MSKRAGWKDVWITWLWSMSLRGMALWEHESGEGPSWTGSCLATGWKWAGVNSGVLCGENKYVLQAFIPLDKPEEKKPKTLAKKELRNSLKIWSKSPFHHVLINVTLTPQKPRESSQRGWVFYSLESGAREQTKQLLWILSIQLAFSQLCAIVTKRMGEAM